MMAAGLGHGVMLIRNKPGSLERAGVVRVGRIGRIEAGHPVTLDGTVVDAATVVWCTGSRPDLGWIRIDGVTDAEGSPVAYRGLASKCPGLAFVGMPFQYGLMSETLVGMDRDAAYVVDVLTKSVDASDTPSARPYRRLGEPVR